MHALILALASVTLALGGAAVILVADRRAAALPRPGRCAGYRHVCPAGFPSRGHDHSRGSRGESRHHARSRWPVASRAGPAGTREADDDPLPDDPAALPRRSAGNDRCRSAGVGEQATGAYRRRQLVPHRDCRRPARWAPARHQRAGHRQAHRLGKPGCRATQAVVDALTAPLGNAAPGPASWISAGSACRTR